MTGERALWAAALVAAACWIGGAGCGRGPAEVLYAAGRSVHAVNPDRGRILWTARVPGEATGLSVSGDGSLVAVAHGSGLAVLEAGARSVLATWSLGPVDAVQVAADGARSYILVGGGDRPRRAPAARRVYCARNKEKYLAWDALVDPRATGLTLSPDGRRLIASAASGSAFFELDLPRDEGVPGRPLRSGFETVPLDSSLGSARFICAGMAPTGGALFLEESGRALQALRWIDPSGKPLARLPLTARVDVGPSALSPDGTRLFVASVSKLIVFDTATGREEGRVELGRTVRGIAVSPRGSRLFVLLATRPGTILVVDIARLKIGRRIELGDEVGVIAAGVRPPPAKRRAR